MLYSVGLISFKTPADKHEEKPYLLFSGQFSSSASGEGIAVGNFASVTTGMCSLLYCTPAYLFLSLVATSFLTIN